MSIHILVRSGLCNRLRVVFSYYKYAITQQKKLIVTWVINPACPQFFDKLFEPINNVTFTNHKFPDDYYTYIGCLSHPEFNEHKMFLYDGLVPKSHILNKIKNILTKLKDNFVAVHIRRTDITPDLKLKHKPYTSDLAFQQFVNENLKHDFKNLYIATDNKETYDKFKIMYPKHVVLPYHTVVRNQHNHKRFRHTRVEDAVVDLFVCSAATNFKGTFFSSFSETICQFRKHRNLPYNI